MKRKIITIILFIFIFFLVIGSFKLNSIITQDISNRIYNSPQIFKKHFEHTLKFDKYDISTGLNSVDIYIHDIVIHDKERDIPIFMLGLLKLKIGVLQSIFNGTPKIEQAHLKSPRLVVEIDENQNLNVLGIGGEDIPGQIDIEPLINQIINIDNFKVSDGHLHLYGPQDSDLPLMDVDIDLYNYSKSSKASIQSSVASSHPMNIALIVDSNPKNNYDKFKISFHGKNILPDKIVGFMPVNFQLTKHGTIDNIDGSIYIENDIIKSFKGNFNFKDLLLKDDFYVEKGVGSFDYKYGELLSLNVNEFKFHYDSISSRNYNLKNIDSRIKIHENNNDFLFDVKSLNLDFEGVPLQSSGVINTTSKKLKDIEFNINYNLLPSNTVISRLPEKVVNKELEQWLYKSIHKGNLVNSKLLYEDDKFNIESNLVNVDLQYNPNWPLIRDIKAKIIYKNDTLEIYADKAKTLNVELNDVSATFSKDNSFDGLYITGQVKSSFTDGKYFIENSPLNNTLGKDLSSLVLRGMFKLDLNLDISLVNDDVDVRGSLITNNGRVIIKDLPELEIKDISGKIDFTDDTVFARKLEYNFFDKSGTANITLDEKNHIPFSVELENFIDVKDIEKILELKRHSNIQGKTNVKTIYTKEKVQFNSDLDGISIDLPQPFYLANDDTLNLQVDYFQNKKLNVQAVTKLYSLLLSLHKEHPIKGNILLGHGKLKEVDNSILITGRDLEIDYSAWEPYFDLDDDNLNVKLDLYAKSFKYKFFELNNVNINYESESKIAKFSSQDINGEVVLKDENAINANFTSINFDKIKINQEDTNSFNIIESEDLPIIDFDSEVLYKNDIKYDNVSLKLFPRSYGYEISEIAANSEFLSGKITGQWDIFDEKRVNISGSLYSGNFGDFLRTFDLGTSITNGSGNIDFSLSWPGIPFSTELIDLEGELKVDIRHGKILGVKQGLGRLIGLLSLDNIQRRLKLDFSDLSSRGMAFDMIIGDLIVNEDKINTNKLMIFTPAAKIGLKGNADIRTKELDFAMYVSPKVGASIPVAAALAGAPAVGAAIWIFDKASGSAVSDITQFKYNITGTFDDPLVNEVQYDHKNKKSKDN